LTTTSPFSVRLHAAIAVKAALASRNERVRMRLSSD
jgi:hypothetical protein